MRTQTSATPLRAHRRPVGAGTAALNATAARPRPSSAPTVAVQFVRLLTDYCERRDLPASRLCAASGTDPARLRQHDARLPIDGFLCMLDCAARALQDPDLGLHVGASMRPGYAGAFGFTLLASRSAAEVWQRCERQYALVQDEHACRIALQGDEYVFHWHSTRPDTPPGRLFEDLTAACWVTLARWLCGPVDTQINWLSFRYEKPADIGAHEALFCCPLRFGARDHGLAVERRYVDLLLPQRDARVLRVMDALCARLLHAVKPRAQLHWLDACRSAIRNGFGRRPPSLEHVAAAAQLSMRELRQRLGEHGTSFRALVDEIRRELALCYLDDPSLDFVDIARRLGFSEQSAFQRAFKRWTGRTPGEHRRAI